MWCVYRDHVCIMVQDTMRKTKNGLRWVYIPEKQWLRMTEDERRRYIA